MKIIKKTSLLCALMLLATAFNTYSMKRTREEEKNIRSLAQLPSGEWVYIVSVILNENTPIKELLNNFDFNELLPELRKEIIFLLASHTNASTLKEAAFTINSLAQVNKELNTLINDPQFCLTNIKYLAQKFKTSDETVARTLATKRAKKILQKQKSLKDKLLHHGLIDEERFMKQLDAYSNNIDMNFTYNLLGSSVTALMLATKEGYKDAIQLFLKKGAEINATNCYGMTVLMFAILQNYPDIDMIQFLIDQKNINLNQQSSRGETALYIACQKYSEDIKMRNLYNKEKLQNIIRALIIAGANPHIANDEGKTPLQLIQEVSNPYEIIDLMQDPINKKHGKI